MKIKKQKFEISVEGSIGLLALGDVGHIAWLKAKNKHIVEVESKKSKNEKT